MVLDRQLRRLGLSETRPPDEAQWAAHLAAVRRAYAQAEQDRYTLERSLMISSREMQELNDGLQRSERNFRMLVEGSPDLVFVYSGDVTLRYVNPALVKALGHADERAVLGLSAFDALVHPDDVRVLHEYRTRRSAGEEVGAIRVRWMRTDGTSIHVEALATPITFDGEPAMLVLARDISDRLRAEALLEERVRVATLGASVGLALTTSDGLEVMLRRCCEALVAHAGAAFARIWTLNRRENVLELRASAGNYTHTHGAHARVRVGELEIGRIAMERASHLTNDVQNDPRVGDREWARREGLRAFVGHPLLVDGEVVGVMALFSREPLTDVVLEGVRSAADAIAVRLRVRAAEEERRVLEERLQHAQKMEAIGRLAGGIAHDFNNILGAILGDVEWIKDQLGDAHELKSEVEEIERAARRAAGLTRQLLAFSRQQVLNPRVLALNSLVSDAERMLRRIIGEDIELVVELDRALGSVRADPGQVEQVLMNLVVNARDAMESGGKLVIATRNVEVDAAMGQRLGDLPPGSYVRVTVTDSGCGMEPGTLARIFEPFFTTKGVGKGTGLGLAMVFGIVKQSRGGIEVVSEVGRGTTFHIYLPRIDAHPSGTHAAVSRRPQKGGGERVLLVEDDPDLRRVAVRVLQKTGYDVTTAECGEDALAHLERDSNFALVVTDLVMPGLDGVAFAGQLRARYPRIRVLLMSGYSDHAVLRRGDVETVGQLLQKPFTAAELASAVRAVLDRQGSTPQHAE